MQRQKTSSRADHAAQPPEGADTVDPQVFTDALCAIAAAAARQLDPAQFAADLDTFSRASIANGFPVSGGAIAEIARAVRVMTHTTAIPPAPPEDQNPPG